MKLIINELNVGPIITITRISFDWKGFYRMKSLVWSRNVTDMISTEYFTEELVTEIERLIQAIIER